MGTLHYAASPDNQYRYLLVRALPNLEDQEKIFMFVGINPSTASDLDDDPTTRKWKFHAVKNGGTSYVAVNPFAARSTDVKGLAAMDDPVGAENDFYIQSALPLVDIIVPCWGALEKIPKSLRSRVKQVEKMLRDSGKPLMCFGRTQNGDPMHPLFLPHSTELVPF